MANPAIRAPDRPGAIGAIGAIGETGAIGAIGAISDLDRRVNWAADPRENNPAVLTHLRLELAEIVPAINCCVENNFRF